jgi:hypothetical protein
MGKNLVVTTEQQDTALRQLGIPISQVVQPDGIETMVYSVNYDRNKIYARVTMIEPDGTSTQSFRQFQISTGWVSEEPNSLTADGTE